MAAAVLLLLASWMPGTTQATDIHSADAHLCEGTSATQIAAWIRQLGSPTFRTRQAATRALKQSGRAAVSSLESAVASTDPEVCRRAVGILVELCLDADPATARTARQALHQSAELEESAIASGAVAGLRRLEHRAAGELQRLGADVHVSDGQYRITFNDQWQGGDTGLAQLMHLRHIAQITFSNASVSDVGLSFLEGHAELEYLLFSNVPLRDESLRHLRDLKQLKSLSLVNAQVTSAGLKNLSGLTGLSHLNLHNATSTDDSGMVYLSAMTSLVRLDLSGTGVTDKGLAELRPLQKLQSLNLNRTAVSAAGLAQLELASLQQLNLNGTQVADDGLALLANVSEDFSYLDLGHTEVTDEGLDAIGRLDGLWYLDLSGTHVSDEGLRHLSNLTNLRNLKLSSTRVRGFGLQHLRGKHLSELTLTNTPLDDRGIVHLKGMTVNALWLDRTQVTGDGLVALQWISELERLYLSGNRIGDADLKHFRPGYFTKLRFLNLSQTQVTYRAVGALRSIMPRCAIQI